MQIHCLCKKSLQRQGLLVREPPFAGSTLLARLAKVAWLRPGAATIGWTSITTGIAIRKMTGLVRAICRILLALVGLSEPWEWMKEAGKLTLTCEWMIPMVSSSPEVVLTATGCCYPTSIWEGAALHTNTSNAYHGKSFSFRLFGKGVSICLQWLVHFSRQPKQCVPAPHRLTNADCCTKAHVLKWLIFCRMQAIYWSSRRVCASCSSKFE